MKRYYGLHPTFKAQISRYCYVIEGLTLLPVTAGYIKLILYYYR